MLQIENIIFQDTFQLVLSVILFGFLIVEHTYNYNTRASLEQLSSRSRLEDLDLPKAVSEKKKQEVLVGYRNFMQREQMNQKHFMMRMFQ